MMRAEANNISRPAIRGSGSFSESSGENLSALFAGIAAVVAKVRCDLRTTETDPDSATNVIKSCRRGLDELARKLDELEMLTREEDSLAVSEALFAELGKHRAEYHNLLAGCKAAQLLVTQRSRDSAKLNRIRLLSSENSPEGANEAELRRRKLSQASQLQSAKQVSDGLRQIKSLMADELAKSAKSLETIENSSETLNLVSKEHQSMTDLISTGRKLTTVLSRRDVTDRVLIALGFLLFLLVVTFVLKRRTGWTAAWIWRYAPI